jgi:hypothetical protein
MKQIRDRVAGLDVHRDTVVACCRVPGTRHDFKAIKRSFRCVGIASCGLTLRLRCSDMLQQSSTPVFGTISTE